jgi:hypothetical protein
MATSSRGSENKWTPEEDEILRAAVEKCGYHHSAEPPSLLDEPNGATIDGKKNSWQKISSCLPGRVSSRTMHIKHLLTSARRTHK